MTSSFLNASAVVTLMDNSIIINSGTGLFVRHVNVQYTTCSQ